MIAVIRYINVATFVHTHSSRVPDLAVGFTPRAKLVQKVAIVVKNLTPKLISLVDNLDDNHPACPNYMMPETFTVTTLVHQPEDDDCDGLRPQTVHQGQQSLPKARSTHRWCFCSLE